MAGTALVVDDDPTLVDVLVVAPEMGGYRVVTAVGAAALALARDVHPDLILLDLMLPGMDGREVSRRLRPDPATADIPLVAMSAHVRGQEMGAQMAVDGRLPKPFDLDALYGTVGRWAGRPR